jgi:hypothetical protein
VAAVFLATTSEHIFDHDNLHDPNTIVIISSRTIRFQLQKIGGYTLLDVQHKVIPFSPYNA